MIQAKQYRAVIFDLDGTLLNTSRGVFSSVLYMAEKMGYPKPEPEVLRTFIGPPIRDSVKRVWGVDDDAAVRAHRFFQEAYIGGDALKTDQYPGMTDLLRALRNRGIRIGVATLKPDEQARRVLGYTGIAPFIDHVCGTDITGMGSKESRIRDCLETFGIPAEESVEIGDTLYDAEGAHAAGADFLAVLYGFGPDTVEEWESAGPVFCAKDTDEIRNSPLGEERDEVRRRTIVSNSME